MIRRVYYKRFTFNDLIFLHYPPPITHSFSVSNLLDFDLEHHLATRFSPNKFFLQSHLFHFFILIYLIKYLYIKEYRCRVSWTYGTLTHFKSNNVLTQSIFKTNSPLLLCAIVCNRRVFNKTLLMRVDIYIL